MQSKNLLAVMALLLVLISCKKERSHVTKEKEFNLSGFTQIFTSEKINLTIEQGANFKIRAKGPAVNVDRLDIKLTSNDQNLEISYKDGATTDPVDVVITLPFLETAYMSGNVIAAIRGFRNQVGNVGLVLSGKANVTVNDGANIFGIEVLGNAQLTLNGTAGSLAGSVLQNATVNAYGLAATRVYIETSHNAKAYVRPSNIFYGLAADESRIYYKGDPANKELETSGNGQIIKEQ